MPTGNFFSSLAGFPGNHPYGGAKKGPFVGHTTPVGSYQPNAWGLYDMHGNVLEWCDSWWDHDLQRIDALEFIGTARVLRGGAWLSVGFRLRSAFRNSSHPTDAARSVGFRVARARPG